jgi:RNA polymerase sigma-70 factor (ECF subfamily)
MALPVADLHEEQSESADVALAAAGDRRAFERLYRTHVNRVFSVCARMVGDRGFAEELVQDVFVRAWEKLPQFRGESAFGTWLHRMTINVVLNARETAARHKSRLGDGDDEINAISHHQPEAGLSMDLEKAIGTLPKGARQVFVLHDVEGFKHEEIADQLGITAGGSKAQLHRARLLLRQVLTR